MANISAEVVEARINEYGKLWTIDDLIRVRAKDKVQVPILAYPKYDNKPTDYEYFTGKDLDRMVDETCHLLVRTGFKVNSSKTVALFAESDLSFVITFFALFRLGCKVLLMSIRLGEPAFLNLLATAECDTVIYGTTARITATVADLKRANPALHFMPIPNRKVFDRPDQPPEPFVRQIADKEAEHVRVSLIMHSSGSTGLPKPLFLSHRSIMSTVPTGTGLRAFNVLPWFHIHGLFTSLMAMWMRQPAHLFNAHLPLTAENLILALKEAQPGICHCVPYALKLMAEREDGIEVLRKCQYVTSAGARTPDELGDRVVKAGVKLGVLYGMTEVGHVGDSLYREPGDDTWDYVRPYFSLRPHMQFKPRGGGVYESVYLASHPALKMSNSDDPPGSFHSRDLWVPHPTLPDAWKYVARDDDTVTLLSGEKILPLGIEGAIRESPLVRDALVVGNDRLVPGVLVFRAAAAQDEEQDDNKLPLSDAEFVDAIWPYVQAGNQLADEFARITRDMVVPVPAGVDYPVTDKNNIIRGAAYAQFADYIESMYTEKPPPPQQNGRGAKNQQTPRPGRLDVPQLERLILDLLRDQADIDMPDVETDFFAAGVDSLRAAQIRRLLLQNVDLGAHTLATNAVYDAGNVARLARRLYAISSGEEGEPTNGHVSGREATNGHGVHGGEEPGNDIQLMEKLIDEYGRFERRQPGELPNPEKETVILTGATGALGAHILHLLLQDPNVEKIYCLVRSSSSGSAKDAADRVQASLHTRRLLSSSSSSTATTPPSFSKLLQQQKLAILTTNDLSAPHLGLSSSSSSSSSFATLAATTTLIVHAAWPVNFNLGLASFRPQLAGLRRLLDLAAGVPFRRPARLLFTSSISAAFRMPRPRGGRSTAAAVVVPEGPLADLAYAAPTGYARSKLVGERICDRAAAAAAAAAVERAVVDDNEHDKLANRNDATSLLVNGHSSSSNDTTTAAVAPHVAVLRVGQITADAEHGIWNAKEAIPLLVRSSAQVGALPRLGGQHGRCEWMPVDTAARATLELAAWMKQTTSSSPPPHEPSHVWLDGVEENGPSAVEKAGVGVNKVIINRDKHNNNGSVVPPPSSALFYNLVAPRHFSWNDEFLPAVRASGLVRFEEVDLGDWLARLRSRAAELGPGEAEARLPAIQLADYYAATYAEEMEGMGKGNEDGHDDHDDGSAAGAVLTWDVRKACAHSEAMRTCPQVVQAGLVPKMVRHWLETDGALI